jgi:hypothetical protein
MGSNIIELAKLGHERAAELKCSYEAINACSLAQLISDLATQLEVQHVRSTNMAVQLANAESKCRALAAELSAVDKIHNEAVFITDDHYEQCPPEVQKMICSLAVLQIPAYDAYLAEVRASSIPDEATERDLFEEWVMEKIFISKTTLEGLRTDDGYRNSTLSGTDYNGMWSQWKAIRAAQLRKGAVL